MRRSDFQTLRVCSWGNRLAKRIVRGEVDPREVIRILEPYATGERQARLREVLRQRIRSVTVVLDSLSDPHNGAALVRTCEAFGLQRIYALEHRSPLLAHAGVTRGTHKWIEVVACEQPADCLAELRREGFVLVAAHPGGQLGPQDLSGIPRLALLLGNEHEGLSPVLLHASELSVRVPMRGFAESLNVSVTGGILLAFATQGRAGDLPEAEQTRLYARGLAVSVPNAEALLARFGGL